MVTLNKKDKIKLKKKLLKKQKKYDYYGLLFEESKTIQRHDYNVIAYLQGNLLLIYLKGDEEYRAVFNWEDIRD